RTRPAWPPPRPIRFPYATLFRSVTTSRARAKIVHWFKQQAREQNVIAGKTMLERELARLDIVGVDYEKLVERTNLKSVEDMFAALGAGDIRLAHLRSEEHTSELQSRENLVCR